ncbi:hypothetical protein WSM22_02020 [Cytophagales bacterium WSM2-2]|nr:hypothetical protein WSM22_02020 [Cytophagales bacterium WSM2-2]
MAAPKFETVRELVAWMGAMQAQDYAMSKWAVGVRLPGTTDKTVEDLIDEAEIVRTHVMRPTWHLVAAEDIRWMLTLTAPHIKASVKSMQKKIGVDEPLFKKTSKIIEKSLEGNKYLTRPELMEELKKKKITTDNLQAIHIMFDAELNNIVCNGPMRGKQFTYALMDERIPSTKVLTRDEALHTLAKKYFTSHGPATIQDFIWWSGLPTADARKGLESIKSTITSTKISEDTFWFPEPPSKKIATPPLLFLPAYDEFMISYKDRTASLDPKFTEQTITGNGIFKPIIVVNGKVVGIWARVVKKGTVIVEPKFFRGAQKLSKKEMEETLSSYGEFLGLEVVVKSR